MKETQTQFKLPGAPRAKQGREVAQKWAWTEASVWTERMLETRERGIKGGKWFSLMDKVWKLENLHSALRQVKGNAGAAGVDADLKGYFDSIPQDKLMGAVEEHIADGAVLRLIGAFLQQGVMESGRGWQPTATGTPQGAVLSPLLANLYLNPLDHAMARQGREMVRHADDFVILCQSQEEAVQTLAKLKQWVQAAGMVVSVCSIPSFCQTRTQKAPKIFTRTSATCG